MNPDYESWTLEVLDAELLRLSQQADELRAQRRQLSGIRDSKIAQREMETKFAAFSDPEKAALAQIVGVDVARLSSVVRDG